MRLKSQLYLHLALSLTFLLHFHWVEAQNYFAESHEEVEFWRAPLVENKPVNFIQEWRTVTGQAAPQKGSRYHFNTKGQLSDLHLVGSWKEEDWKLEYDASGRLTKISMFVDQVDSSYYFFNYLSDRDVMEERADNYLHKTILYKDEQDRVIEKKLFYVDTIGRSDFRLVRRTLYNYNALGKVFGEMRYLYSEEGVVTKQKSLHTFDSTGTKLIKTTFYTPTGIASESRNYTYDSSGQIISFEQKRIPDGNLARGKSWTYKKGELHLYKDDIYLTTSPAPSFETFRVYQDGRMIFKKMQKGKSLLYESQYQYGFD